MGFEGSGGWSSSMAAFHDSFNRRKVSSSSYSTASSLRSPRIYSGTSVRSQWTYKSEKVCSK